MYNHTGFMVRVFPFKPVKLVFLYLYTKAELYLYLNQG